MDVRDIQAGIADLMRGETEPMARYLQSGGELTPGIRAALVQHLRAPKKPRKRRWAQEQRELDVVWLFVALHYMGGLHRAEAIRRILEMEPNLTQSTVENYLRNFLGNSEH